MKALDKAAIGPSLLLILGASLFPFDFMMEAPFLSWKVLVLSPGNEANWEIAVNVLLYFPLGLGVSAYLRGNGLGKLRILALIMVTSLALSYLLETLQSFLPTRFPSWRDVVSNTSGALLGSLSNFACKTKGP